MNAVRYIFILLSICFISVHAIAQQFNKDSIFNAKDSSIQVDSFNNLSEYYLGKNNLDSAILFALKAQQLAKDIQDTKGEATALYHIGAVYNIKGKLKKALSSFLSSLKVKHLVKDKRLAVKIYFNMANILARLKFYPQALKYYYRMQTAYENGKQKNNYLLFSPSNKSATDSTKEKIFANNTDSTINMDSSAIAMNIQNDLISSDDTADFAIKNYIADSLERAPSETESIPLPEEDITSYFNDGKKALAYGLMVHVKQPKAGDRTAFANISNVGHMFVTLIKFNPDTSIRSRTFGFYPKKDFFLSATPIVPSSSSEFKDDAQHEWDELVGKFITRRKFEKIIKLVKDYKNKKYNLNSNNCTDFGLEIAAIAGIKIKETLGDWPLGGGNNPGSAGQSILEGKINDEDKDNNVGLFIFNSLKK